MVPVGDGGGASTRGIARENREQLQRAAASQVMPCAGLPPSPAANAFDYRFTPGGSSCGSAVAVAEGMCTFALGTDTAGSGAWVELR